MASSSSSPSSPIEKLRGLLSSTLRITVSDGRIFLGSFIGTDQPMNILLTDTEEYRIEPVPGDGNQIQKEQGEEEERGTELGITNGRFVGQVLIPWKIIRKIEVQESQPQKARTMPSYEHGSMGYII
ncbi:hypothetical protein GYMLUDRAFT_38544 [Collybiopsis luxurians FD-317 M1]|nr:hypothetical protein GYMLUDRAFT_38544 [Collybiopsis luxurians FD-317 M1]